jgi:hypothetical protein
MPTVTAADEGLSSCSQNAAYSATIMAAQIRSANAQAESGNPTIVTARRTLDVLAATSPAMALIAASCVRIGSAVESKERICAYSVGELKLGGIRSFVAACLV